MNKTASQYSGESPETRSGRVRPPMEPIMPVCILLAAIAAGEISYAVNPGTQIAIAFYLLAVQIISATAPSRIYGTLAAIIGAFTFDFLITEPRMAFSFTAGFSITLPVMLAVSVASSAITARIRARAVRDENSLRARQLHEINQRLLSADDLDAIAAVAVEYITERLGYPAVLYTKAHANPDAALHNLHKSAHKLTAALRTPEQREIIRLEFLSVRPEAEPPYVKDNGVVLNIPIASRGRLLGVIGIAHGDKPVNDPDMDFIRMLAGQIAPALELWYASDEQKNIVAEAEREKTRATLLRSISHDLRTPLTGIKGTCSTILEREDIDSDTLKSLVTDIDQYSQWLIRMVENILIITRVSGGRLNVRKEPAAAEEIVAEAVSIVRKRFCNHYFIVHVPDELLLVPMDGTLISQALINLLENAAKNSPEDSFIFVCLSKKDNFAIFDVIDNGNGIPAHLTDNLFEAYSTLNEQAVDISRGTGLGLSICKAIVQAHGGTIEGYNRSKLGAKFSFQLPLEDSNG